jgi:hypothetical protein
MAPIKQSMPSGRPASPGLVGEYAGAHGQGEVRLLLIDDSTYKFSCTEDLRTLWSFGRWSFRTGQLCLSSSFQPADTSLLVSEIQTGDDKIVFSIIDTSNNGPLPNYWVKIGGKEYATDEIGKIAISGDDTLTQFKVQGFEPYMCYSYKVINPRANHFLVKIFERRDSYVFFRNDVFLITRDTLKYDFGHGRYLLTKQ